MASRQTAVARGPAVAAGLPREGAGLPGAVPAPRRLDNALERPLRLASPIRPPWGQGGKHRRRCALPVRRHALTEVPGRQRCWRALADSVGAACPHTPRRSLRSVVGPLVFDWPGCVRPGTGGERVLLPLTASRGGGAHGWGRPLAAARGCRLLRRFFFLLKQRKVIPAGPRPGQASRRSVRQRTLDMALSARIGTAREGGRKRQMPQQPAAFAARGRTACFTPRRHGRNWRSGGSTGTRRCTAAAHSPQKNPLAEDR
jgi:hypothetical protein